MVLERIVDTLSILIVGTLLMIFQYQLLFDLLSKTYLAHYSGSIHQFTTGYLGIVLIVALITLGGGFFYFLYYMRDHHILGKVWKFISGILNGLASILKLDNPLLFIFYSFLIWFMYFLMIYICFSCLPETSGMGVFAGLACLFFGGFAYIISPGGLGTYPPIIGAVLVLYKVAFTIGFGFGWLVWSVQTGAVIVFGVISFILVSRNFSVTTKTQQV